MPDKQPRTRPAPMLARRPPLAAYREDLARREGRPFGPSDATWLTLATILDRGADVAPDARPPLLDALRDVVGSDPALRELLPAQDGESPPESELDAAAPI